MRGSQPRSRADRRSKRRRHCRRRCAPAPAGTARAASRALGELDQQRREVAERDRRRRPEVVGAAHARAATPRPAAAPSPRRPREFRSRVCSPSPITSIVFALGREAHEPADEALARVLHELPRPVGIGEAQHGASGSRRTARRRDGTARPPACGCRSRRLAAQGWASSTRQVARSPVDLARAREHHARVGCRAPAGLEQRRAGARTLCSRSSSGWLMLSTWLTLPARLNT